MWRGERAQHSQSLSLKMIERKPAFVCERKRNHARIIIAGDGVDLFTYNVCQGTLVGPLGARNSRGCPQCCVPPSWREPWGAARRPRSRPRPEVPWRSANGSRPARWRRWPPRVFSTIGSLADQMSTTHQGTIVRGSGAMGLRRSVVVRRLLAAQKAEADAIYDRLQHANDKEATYDSQADMSMYTVGFASLLWCAAFPP